MSLRRILLSTFCCIAATTSAVTQAETFQDDFSGGLNLPWLFLDDFGDIPPSFTEVTSNDADQDLKFTGSAQAYDDENEFNLSVSGYVGLSNPEYLFENEVHVTATVRQTANLTLGLEEGEPGNNDMFVIARGEGLTGYVFAIDTELGEADIVRVDDGTVVALGDDAVLRDLPLEQDAAYTLRLSAVDDMLTGQVYDEEMTTLIGEVSIFEDTYSSGWAGIGSAINDGGDEFFRTLISASFDNFTVSDTLDIVVEPVTIDELTAAINAGLTDAKFDLDNNGSVDAADRTAWVTVLNNTYFGDSNLDGEFNSSDFVTVFGAGEYEDETAGNSLWAEGDWNGDGDFNSGDFVLAFSGGGYEKGPRAPQAVPEPAAIWLLLAGLFSVSRFRQAA